MKKRATPEMLASYREYTARCQVNGVFPPYEFRTWIRKITKLEATMQSKKLILWMTVIVASIAMIGALWMAGTVASILVIAAFAVAGFLIGLDQKKISVTMPETFDQSESAKETMSPVLNFTRSANFKFGAVIVAMLIALVWMILAIHNASSCAKEILFDKNNFPPLNSTRGTLWDIELECTRGRAGNQATGQMERKP